MWENVLKWLLKKILRQQQHLNRDLKDSYNLIIRSVVIGMIMSEDRGGIVLKKKWFDLLKEMRKTNVAEV